MASRRLNLISFVAMSFVVVSAWLLGSTVSALAIASTLALVGTVAGFSLAVAAAAVGFQRRLRMELLPGLALVTWTIVAAANDPFVGVCNANTFFAALAWLVPLIVGGTVLLRRGAWLSAGACWALLFAATTALAYTARAVDSAVGLVVKQLS